MNFRKILIMVTPMSIPPRFLDDLRARLTLSDIIGRRIRVTRAGREFKACCPFHKEKSPSFTINDAKQFYHCFGCGAHGDVLKFVMEHDNLEFRTAVEMLATEAGMQVPQASPQDIQKSKQRGTLYDLMEETANWFQEQMCAPGNTDILTYVRDRGLTEETIQAFKVGYAPADYDSLKTYLKEKDYTEQQMLAVGILKKSERDGKTYSFFRDRVMTPVRDFRGRIVAFGGRILPEHMRPPDRGDFTPPKYINSSETEIFHKSRVLYGGEIARMVAGKGNPIIVTEGYFDVIAAHQAGFTGAVAPMGTSLTEDQMMLLWKMMGADSSMVKEPILCFDGDNAGRRAAERACKMILPMLEAGRSARFAFLPNGEDPDSIIKSGGAKSFQAVLNSAMPLFDFLWSMHAGGQSFETPDSRAALVKILNTEIQDIQDREVQKHYDSRLKDKIYQNFYNKKKKSAQNRGGQGNQVHTGVRLRSPANNARDIKVRILLACILNYPEIYEDVEEEFWQFDIADKSRDALRQSMMSALNEEPGLDREALHRHISNGASAKELGDILSNRTYIHAKFCAPGYEDEPDMVKQKWLEILQSVHDGTVKDEIRQGWKRAFRESDESEEDKLRKLLKQNQEDAGTGTE